MKTYFEVIFDTETKKFFDEVPGNDPSKLGVSITSVYSRTLDENFKEVEVLLIISFAFSSLVLNFLILSLTL